MIIEISTPAPDDVYGIQEVFYKTWLATYPNEEAGITVGDIEDKFKDSFTEETLQNRKKAYQAIPENIKILIAKDGSKVVGVCRLVKRESVDQLQAIYVLPEYQGKGIGYKLWKEGIKFLNDNKDVIVQVAEYNQNAISFYEKLGFVDNGKRFTEERHKMKSGALIPEMEMTLKRK